MTKGTQIFFKPSFRETIHKSTFESFPFYVFNKKMLIHVLTLISECLVFQLWKLNDSWKNNQTPLKERKNAFEEKSEYFHRILRFFNKQFVAVSCSKDNLIQITSTWPWMELEVTKVKKVKFWKMLQIAWNVCRIKNFLKIHT